MRCEILSLVFLLSACATHTTLPGERDPVGPMPNYTSLNGWMERNPCGMLKVRSPLYNASGDFGSAKSVGGWVSLHIAPNLTRAAAQFAAESCAPLGRVSVAESGSFVFPSLPAGRYVAVALVFPRDENSSLAIQYESSPDFGVVEVDAFREGNWTFSLFSVREGRNETG